MAAGKKLNLTAEQKLTEANRRIVELEKALADQKEFDHSFLEAALHSIFQENIRSADAASAQLRAKEKDTTALDAEANTWRKASQVITDCAGKKFPYARSILAAAEDVDTPPQKSHLLFIALLLKILAGYRGSGSGLQAEIIKKAQDLHLNVVGLSKSNQEKILSAANKAADEVDLIF